MDLKLSEKVAYAEHGKPVYPPILESHQLEEGKGSCFKASDAYCEGSAGRKDARWIKKKYFRSLGVKWVFSHKFKDKNGKKKTLELV